MKKPSYDQIEIGGTDTGEPINISRRIDLIGAFTNLDNQFILDGGCGSGSYVLKFLDFSENVFGIENSAEKVDAFKSLGIFSDHVIQGDIEDMPYDDRKFDIVFLNEVLEHVPNQELALKEIFRVMKDSGVLVIMSPNRFYPFETHGVVYKPKNQALPISTPFIPYIPVKIGKKIFSYPARNYFPWDLRNIINENGFKVVKHTFISQTFEGIGGHNSNFHRQLRPFLRKIFFVMEDIPLLNLFACVSQVVFARKEPD